MSGKLAKSQVPIIRQRQLPLPAKRAIAQLKNDLRRGQLPRRFGNTSRDKAGSPLPRLDDGCVYFEVQVGHGRPGPADRGAQRLVVEIDEKSRQIREIYFTQKHYCKGTFYRVV